MGRVGTRSCGRDEEKTCVTARTRNGHAQVQDSMITGIRGALMPVITPRLTGHNARRGSGIIGARWRKNVKIKKKRTKIASSRPYESTLKSSDTFFSHHRSYQHWHNHHPALLLSLQSSIRAARAAGRPSASIHRSRAPNSIPFILIELYMY